VADAYGDLNMRALAKGDVIQLERKGYWIVDRAADPSDPQKVRFQAVIGSCNQWGLRGLVHPCMLRLR
jgi:hypothetical protein